MNIVIFTAEKRAQGTPRSRALGAIGLLLSSALALGCAKSPTGVNVQVSADDTIPPLMILRSKIARDADPLSAVPNEILSRSYSSDAGTPDPFRFPLRLPVPVPSGWSGPVTITVEGLSWDTGAVIASGFTAATATRETTTEAMLTLSGVPGQGGEGDGGGDGGTDGGSTDSAGGDEAGTDGSAQSADGAS